MAIGRAAQRASGRRESCRHDKKGVLRLDCRIAKACKWRGVQCDPPAASGANPHGRRARNVARVPAILAARGYTRLPMPSFNQFRRHIFRWIACFAILLNALAPTVSQALTLATGQATGWTQICSLAGLRWVALEQDQSGKQDSTSAPTDQSGAEQCPFCAAHAGSSGFAPAVHPTFVPTIYTPVRPSALVVSAVPFLPLLRARERAPPRVA